LVSLGAAKLVSVTGFSNVAGITRCVSPETLQRNLGASWLVAPLEVWLAVICMAIKLQGLPLEALHACAYRLRSGLLESTDFDFVFDFVVFEIDLTPVADVAALPYYAVAAAAFLEDSPTAYGLHCQTLTRTMCLARLLTHMEDDDRLQTSDICVSFEMSMPLVILKTWSLVLHRLR
jgi:hypothetical protein